MNTLNQNLKLKKITCMCYEPKDKIQVFLTVLFHTNVISLFKDLCYTIYSTDTGLRSAVYNKSDCNHEIISTVILLLSLIQEGLL